MTPDRLKTLRNLAEHKRLKDMAALTRANAESALTAAQMKALAMDVSANLADTPPEDLAIISRWLDWSEQERARLITRRAILEQRVNTARTSALFSDAKTRVIGDMLIKAEHQELLHARRKAEQEGRAPER